jgi:hypothetical protein
VLVVCLSGKEREKQKETQSMELFWAENGHQWIQRDPMMIHFACMGLVFYSHYIHLLPMIYTFTHTDRYSDRNEKHIISNYPFPSIRSSSSKSHSKSRIRIDLMEDRGEFRNVLPPKEDLVEWRKELIEEREVERD